MNQTTRRESQADSILTGSLMSHFVRDTSSVRSNHSDVDTAAKETIPAPSRGKTAGAKLRLALSLLRRRSNPNLRRAYVEPIKEAEERENSWGPFNEPLLDPDLVEPRDLAPKRSDSSSRQGKKISSSKSHGFKFTLPSRSGTTRQVLTKVAPRETSLRPRRATVASERVDSHSQVNTLWNDFEARPRSSQSTDIAIAPEEPSSDSIFSRESTALGGSSPGGGLFPRPASLQRNWNDGLPKPEISVRHPAIDRISSMSSARITNIDRVRPVSFGGMPTGNHYENMKITEAASLENRVKELEAKVASLEGLTHECTRHQHESPLGLQPSESYSAISQSRTSNQSDLGQHQINSTEVYGTQDYTEPENNLNLQNIQNTFHTMEGFPIDPENKRNTISTIRAPMSRRSEISASFDGSSVPSSSISPAEYTGMVSMFKKEHRARKKLESQVAALQEQMATVLHRQLTAQSGPHTTKVHHHDLSVLSRPEFNRLHSQCSNEDVQTPDLTPPPASLNQDSSHLFTSFDSEMVTDTDNETDDDTDNNRIHRTSKRHNRRDVWESPSQENENMLDQASDCSSRDKGQDLNGRTLSLSLLTQKCSKLNR
ncbi:hypothetical protein EDC01DRAFT_732559 [Geopyxis carbonaria]|nr:hypothetical protein EDC01DRAFT_732559 [Geopyxis carbonaria]